MPLISVILPTWNRASLLPRALASVAAQTWTEWELLAVDDGSTDDTPLLLARAAAADPRIRPLSHAHVGPAVCRNAGLAAARGDLVTFLDSDDEYLPAHLALRASYMAAHPDADMLSGGFIVIGTGAQLLVPDAEDPARRIDVRRCAVGGTFVARRGIIEAAGGWRPGYAEDADLLARVRARSRVHTVDFPTYVYHRDGTDSRCDEQGLELRGSETKQAADARGG
jgi:glycosyltransferase involved in cell wall biosynthesis